MLVRILGSAAGGGFPQWNCGCPNCRAVRTGTRPTRPRLQSSIAVRAEGGPWVLANASPDVRQQLETLERSPNGAVRTSPIAAVVLTDAEIDHTAGLIVLRESIEPLKVFGTSSVRGSLTRSYPVVPVLGHYCDVEWTTLAPGEPAALPGGLEADVFEAGGDPPLYAEGDGEGSVGITFRDPASGGVLTYVPGLAAADEALAERLDGSDCVLLDGTFWNDDELIQLGIGTRTARAMGHIPLAGPGGSLEFLATLERPRRILVHINNTNPILLEDSAESRAVESAGVEVGLDGMTIEL